MTLAERLIAAARQAVDSPPSKLGGTVNGSDILNHTQNHRAHAATAAVLRALAAFHTVDAGTWWEQNDPIPTYKLIELADEIEAGTP